MNNNEEFVNKDVEKSAELTNDDLTNAVGGESCGGKPWYGELSNQKISRLYSPGREL